MVYEWNEKCFDDSNTDQCLKSLLTIVIYVKIQKISWIVFFSSFQMQKWLRVRVNVAVDLLWINCLNCMENCENTCFYFIYIL